MSRSLYEASIIPREIARVPQSHIKSGELAQRSTQLAVPHALWKCRRCGSTLVNDPLPHHCGSWSMRAADPFELLA